MLVKACLFAEIKQKVTIEMCYMSGAATIESSDGVIKC